MKNVLFGMERCPGRVDLSRFYAASLYEDRWQFSESAPRLPKLRSSGGLKTGELRMGEVKTRARCVLQSTAKRIDFDVEVTRSSKGDLGSLACFLPSQHILPTTTVMPL